MADERMQNVRLAAGAIDSISRSLIVAKEDERRNERWAIEKEIHTSQLDEAYQKQNVKALENVLRETAASEEINLENPHDIGRFQQMLPGIVDKYNTENTPKLPATTRDIDDAMGEVLSFNAARADSISKLAKAQVENLGTSANKLRMLLTKGIVDQDLIKKTDGYLDAYFDTNLDFSISEVAPPGNVNSKGEKIINFKFSNPKTGEEINENITHVQAAGRLSTLFSTHSQDFLQASIGQQEARVGKNKTSYKKRQYVIGPGGILGEGSSNINVYQEKQFAGTFSDGSGFHFSSLEEAVVQGGFKAIDAETMGVIKAREIEEVKRLGRNLTLKERKNLTLDTYVKKTYGHKFNDNPNIRDIEEAFEGLNIGSTADGTFLHISNYAEDAAAKSGKNPWDLIGTIAGAHSSAVVESPNIINLYRKNPDKARDEIAKIRRRNNPKGSQDTPTNPVEAMNVFFEDHYKAALIEKGISFGDTAIPTGANIPKPGKETPKKKSEGRYQVTPFTEAVGGTIDESFKSLGRMKDKIFGTKPPAPDSAVPEDAFGDQFDAAPQPQAESKTTLGAVSPPPVEGEPTMTAPLGEIAGDGQASQVIESWKKRAVKDVKNAKDLAGSVIDLYKKAGQSAIDNSFTLAVGKEILETAKYLNINKKEIIKALTDSAAARGEEVKNIVVPIIEFLKTGPKKKVRKQG